MSLGRVMGEWLGDTLEAVEFTASRVEAARAAPKLAMREMHAYALGIADETGALLRSMGKGGTEGGALPKARPHAALSLPPRPVIRGGKSPGKTSTKGKP